MSKYIIIYIHIYIHNIYIYIPMIHEYMYHDFSMVITIRSQVINGFFANTGGSGQVGVDRMRRLGLHRIPTGDRCGRDEGWRSRVTMGGTPSHHGTVKRSTWRIWGSPIGLRPRHFLAINLIHDIEI